VTGTAATAVWLDGRLVEPGEARVSAFDHGFTVGDGVFETLRVYAGTPFALRRHLDRLGRSAAGLGLALPDRSVLERACAEVVAAGGGGSARLRLTVTGGPGPLGSARGGGAPTVVVVAAPLAPVRPVATVAVAPWPRNERGPLAGLKPTSYAENVVLLAWARERGAEEAVVADTTGRLCEGTGANVFVVHGGRVRTPALSSGCLAGVTRELVLERTDAEEADLAVDDLLTADEAFLTSSTREVQPIGSIEDRPLPAAPGPSTAAAATAFRALVGSDLDP
jgi:branched-chain amino acid aminotransferase